MQRTLALRRSWTCARVRRGAFLRSLVGLLGHFSQVVAAGPECTYPFNDALAAAGHSPAAIVRVVGAPLGTGSR